MSIIKMKSEYNHPEWPSPRAANCARALGQPRLKHIDALQFLAARVGKTVDQLRQMRWNDYAADHMSHDERQVFYRSIGR